MHWAIMSFILLFRVILIHSHRPILRTFSSLARNGVKYNIRQASVDDIFRINQCNLDNLRENYSYQFYLNHITRYPDLSLIAETDQYDMVGYALGRLEMVPNVAEENSMYCGHLVSLAVNPSFRGNGVARHLLDTIHEKLAKDYSINSISLFCRVSNIPACNLYQKVFNYQIEKVIPEYYSDKEDAYFMSSKGLKENYQTNSISHTSSSTRKFDAIEMN